ncbi:MAG: phosphoglycerate kinase [Thermoplasmataceae archaeon]
MATARNDFFTLDDFNLDGKTVFLRLDINAPIDPSTGDILDYSRFSAHVDTINELRGAKVIIIAHQSRPGKDDFVSLRTHAAHMSMMAKRDIRFVDQLFGSAVTATIQKMKPGDIIMLENSRFYSEEVSLDGADLETMVSSNIVRMLAPLMDYYVIDAFPAIHRPQITLTGFRSVKPNIAGRLIEREISALEKFKSPSTGNKIAILAGAKISDSITVTGSFLEKGVVQYVLAAGVVGNAFLHAIGKNIGERSLAFIKKNNKNYTELIKMCADLYKKFPGRIILPDDAILNPSGRRIEIGSRVPDTELIADIGIDTIVKFSGYIKKADGIFMNGPMGMYEIDQYSAGTREIFSEVAESRALTIAGGGHTLSALERMGLMRKITHASTGGGALISYLSGEHMPVLEALMESRKLFAGK